MFSNSREEIRSHTGDMSSERCEIAMHRNGKWRKSNGFIGRTGHQRCQCDTLLAILVFFHCIGTELGWNGGDCECGRCNLLRFTWQTARIVWATTVLGCCRLGHIYIDGRLSSWCNFRSTTKQKLFCDLLFNGGCITAKSIRFQLSWGKRILLIQMNEFFFQCFQTQFKSKPFDFQFKPNKFSSSIIRDVGKLFKSARIVVFFLWCISVGLCTALVWNFLFWHLEDLADQRGEWVSWFFELCEQSKLNFFFFFF